jgi:hypothetical protein
MTDEKCLEKFKPEESIQYECHHHIIEQQPEHRRNTTATASKIDNLTKTLTRQKVNEQLERIEQQSDGAQIATHRTDTTTLITEESDEHITETIEQRKDIQEFVYRQMRHKSPKKERSGKGDEEGVLVESNLMMSLAEHLIVEEETNNRNSNNKMPEIIDSQQQQQQHENNILDFYKLQPSSSNSVNNADDEEEEEEEMIHVCDYVVELRVPIEMSALPHGEEFKPHESTTYDDNTYVKSVKSTASPVTTIATTTAHTTLNDLINDGNESCQTEMNDECSYTEDMCVVSGGGGGGATTPATTTTMTEVSGKKKK